MAKIKYFPYVLTGKYICHRMYKMSPRTRIRHYQMAFLASILHVSVVVVVLLATTAAALVAGGTNTTTAGNTTITVRSSGKASALSATATTLVAGGTNATAATNTTVTVLRGSRSSSSKMSTAESSGEQEYICYLCRGRNTLMIRWCPLDLDECHIACLSSPSRSPDYPRALRASPADDDDRNADDCYVMKLYPDGSWVVVDVVSCQASAGCLLACSYGEVRLDDAAGGRTTPATAFSPLPLGLADFQRCGDQLVAPRVAVPGV
ncbi:hypothetical protein GUJ93_ZPchr0006g44584 [Zizania palustris]|uniref:Uncharacterized protein n=1 Tax=Zizania palustris TaxID=103762 RepID=A0A8J5VW79_ZIZPA|nr:hypothetical protein GUJ93_ZPchr0006g44584 [Zizania palustris]